MSVENLKYLSVDQALADVAHFITEIKSNAKYTNSPVVVIGVSYAASMATWFRQKYPHLAVGAWASSAPLLAQVDFKEYKEVVAQSLALAGGQDCLDAVAKGFQLTAQLIAENRTTELMAAFNLCDDFDVNNRWNVWNLHSEISDIFAGVVQGHRCATKHHSIRSNVNEQYFWLFVIYFYIPDPVALRPLVLLLKITPPTIHAMH